VKAINRKLNIAQLKLKGLNLSILIVIILLIVEFVFFYSTDWGENCRNTVRGTVSQVETSKFNYQHTATKRYCLTLNQKDDPDLISEYRILHEHVWSEITEGFVEVGIVDMEIYLFENKLFMILETKKDFDIKKDFEQMGQLSRQKEWENLVSKFQDTDDPESIDKWKVMERIYKFRQRDINK
jgi:L-rhamnose mutarotase